MGSTTPARVVVHIAAMLLVWTASAAPAAVRADTPVDTRAKGSSAFAVPRHAITGGGGPSSAGPFAIQGSIGQLDADPFAPSVGGPFAVSGGFWPGIALPAPATDSVFADGFEAAAR